MTWLHKFLAFLVLMLVLAWSMPVLAQTEPTITGISPSSGSTGGGTSVTITGTNFAGVTSVRFGATSASYIVNSTTSIFATPPPGSAGTVDITVATPSGTSAISALDRYTYIAAPTAASISLSNVPFSSGAIPIPIDLSNHITLVVVGTAASHGTATATGTTLTYTPTAGYSGTDTFTYTMTNVAGTSTPGTVTVTVLPSTFAYSPSAPAAGTVGVAYSTTSLASASGGSGTYAYAVVSGALPPGLTLNANGMLSGTPSVSGTFSFSVRATDTVTTSNPPVTSGSLTMTVNAPVITFAPVVLPDATAAVAYSQTIQASGGMPPYTYVLAGTLPAGLTWNAATGTISGIPTQTSAGSAVTVMATDANNFSASIGYNAHVSSPNLNILTSTLANATLGASYSQAVTVSGANAGFTVSVTGLPNGLQFTQSGSGGSITGVPTAAGVFSVTIRLNDSTTGTGAPFSRTLTLPLSVNTGAMTLTPTTLPTPIAGQAYNQTLTATGGVAPYRYTVTAGSLPAGLTLNPVSGELSGTAMSTGTSVFTITAKDSSTGPGTPLTAVNNYTFNITGQVASAPSVHLQTFTHAPVTFRASANAIGGPFTNIAIASPPASGTAVVNGEDIVYTPVSGTNGDVTFTYTLTNAVGTSAPVLVTITVTTQAPVANAVSATVAANSSANSINLSLGGGTAIAVAIGTQATHGTAVASGTSITYAPVAGYSGSDSFTYTATNAGGTSAPATVTITVSKPIPTAPAVTVSTLANKSVTIDAAANASSGPFTELLVSTPPSIGTVVVQGMTLVYTPVATTSGPVNFAYTLRNSTGVSLPISVTVQVNPVPVVLAPIQVTGQATQPVSVDVTAGATGGPFIDAAILGVTPANAGTSVLTNVPSAQAASMQGVSAKAALTGQRYTVTFTPAAAFAGTAVVSYTLSNSFATSAPATLSITVAPRLDPSTDADVRGLVNAQIQSARRFATAQLSNYQQRLEQLRSPQRQAFSNQLNVIMPRAVGSTSRDCQSMQNPMEQQACFTAAAHSSGASQFNQGVRNDRAAKMGLPEGSAGFTDSRDTVDFAVARLAGMGNGAGTGARNGMLPDMGGAGATAEGAANRPQLAFWTAGSVDFGFADANRQQSGFRFTTSGVTVGADYLVTNKLAVGVGLGYGHDNTRIGDMGTRSSADSISVALYGSYSLGQGVYVDGVAGYNRLRFDSSRWVDAVSDFARGRRNGDQWFASVSAGYEYRDSQWLISPYSRVQVSSSNLKRYDEKGAGINALTYFDQRVTTTSGVLGLRTEISQDTRWGVLQPFARMEYQHDFEGQSDARLSYADIVGLGSVYQISGTPYGRDRVQLGLGSKLKTKAGTWSLDFQLMRSSGMLDRRARIMFTTQY